MSFAKTHSGQFYFLKGQIIDIEVDLSRGLHSFSIVGLPDKAVEEARDRISAAIKNSGFISPKQKNHRVVISLAPAHVRKEGTHFDLALAVGYLLASDDISFDPAGKIFVGELSLDGKLRKVRGVLAITIEARQAGFSEIFVPKENVGEAKLVEGISVVGISSLRELVEKLDQKNIHRDEQRREKNLPESSAAKVAKNVAAQPPVSTQNKKDFSLFDSINGQAFAKRALQIAAAGGHNILFIGPPGTGKTMLAQSLQTILPALKVDHALEVTSIHSILGLTTELISTPPFRAPHHTSTYSALIGGGNIPKPGEVTLAHRGILFLDEFAEFDRRVIEALRQPLESRVVNISRTKGSVYFPAHFMLVAAMNPCPCGFFTSKKKTCTCTAADINRYKKKISGPILDRIDISVEVGDVEYTGLGPQQTAKQTQEPCGEMVARHILKARNLQNARFESLDQKISLNSEMDGEDLALFSHITPQAARTLIAGAEALNLSMRGYHRAWRLARTIADLGESKEILESHILEALQFRIAS